MSMSNLFRIVTISILLFITTTILPCLLLIWTPMRKYDFECDRNGTIITINTRGGIVYDDILINYYSDAITRSKFCTRNCFSKWIQLPQLFEMSAASYQIQCRTIGWPFRHFAIFGTPSQTMDSIIARENVPVIMRTSVVGNTISTQVHFASLVGNFALISFLCALLYAIKYFVIKKVRSLRGDCVFCGYNINLLRYKFHRCPECGREVGGV